MATEDHLTAEKAEQASHILHALDIDVWLIFVRESGALHDPALDLVIGAGVVGHAAFVITRTGERIALVAEIDRGGLSGAVPHFDVRAYKGGIGESLRALLGSLAPRRIAINESVDDPTADGLTHGMYLLLMRILEGTPHGERIESAGTLMAKLRGQKTPGEVARIEAACEVALGILEGLTERLAPGMTERQVAGWIREAMGRTPGIAHAWEEEHCPAVFTGPESVGAHAAPGDRRLEPGHLLNVDFGVRRLGYVSDLQRTWYLLREGEKRPPPTVERGFTTILAAIREGARALRPGITGWEVDDAVRSTVTSAGYAEYCHGTGHQIGRAAHDGGGGLFPRWERYGELPLRRVEEGQCYTIEPRLDVPGHGIATCEEVVIVEGDGARYLSRPQEAVWIVPASAGRRRSPP